MLPENIGWMLVIKWETRAVQAPTWALVSKDHPLDLSRYVIICDAL